MISAMSNAPSSTHNTGSLYTGSIGLHSSASSLLSNLSSQNATLVKASLHKLLRVVDTLWHEISTELPILEEIAEDDTKEEETRQVAAAVASRVFFHLEEYR